MVKFAVTIGGAFRAPTIGGSLECVEESWDRDSDNNDADLILIY